MSELRITPEEVLAAYEKTGIVPKCGIWWEKRYGSEELCGCPLTVLFFVAHPDEKPQEFPKTNRIWGWAEQTYGEPYYRAFFNHVDGFASVTESLRAEQGKEDGQAVRRACKAKFLTF